MPSVLGENALISFLFDSFPLFLTGNASFHSNSDKLSYPPPLQPDIWKLSTPTIAIERKRSIALSVKQTLLWTQSVDIWVRWFLSHCSIFSHTFRNLYGWLPFFYFFFSEIRYFIFLSSCHNYHLSYKSSFIVFFLNCILVWFVIFCTIFHIWIMHVERQLHSKLM